MDGTVRLVVVVVGVYLLVETVVVGVYLLVFVLVVYVVDVIGDVGVADDMVVGD